MSVGQGGQASLVSVCGHITVCTFRWGQQVMPSLRPSQKDGLFCSRELRVFLLSSSTDPHLKVLDREAKRTRLSAVLPPGERAGQTPGSANAREPEEG